MLCTVPTRRNWAVRELASSTEVQDRSLPILPIFQPSHRRFFRLAINHFAFVGCARDVERKGGGSIWLLTILYTRIKCGVESRGLVTSCWEF